jgi:hypothetical protein
LSYFFKVIYLNSQNQVIDTEDIFHGTVNSSSVHVREVMESALRNAAVSLIFAHNHPTGNPEGCDADKSFGPHRHRQQHLFQLRRRRLYRAVRTGLPQVQPLSERPVVNMTEMPQPILKGRATVWSPAGKIGELRIIIPENIEFSLCYICN